jgi:hypothetical protein
MSAESAKILADAVNEYFSPYEVEDLCRQHGIELEYSGSSPNFLKLAGILVADRNSPVNRRFLLSLLKVLQGRCSQQIQNVGREDKLYHQQMNLQLKGLLQLLSEERPQPAIAKPARAGPASRRSQLVEFFGRATTPVTVVDADVGVATLDCLRKVATPIRLLTAERDQGFEADFTRAVKYFRERGKAIEMRLQAEINDRILAFNHRCWLLGSSLKQVDQPNFTRIEIIDCRDAIIRRLEECWGQAETVIFA